MPMHCAEFVPTHSRKPTIYYVDTTEYKAIRGLKRELRRILESSPGESFANIVANGGVPEQIDCSDNERDICAVLFGSNDLRPHIRVRTLPPHF